MHARFAVLLPCQLARDRWTGIIASTYRPRPPPFLCSVCSSGCAMAAPKRVFWNKSREKPVSFGIGENFWCPMERKGRRVDGRSGLPLWEPVVTCYSMLAIFDAGGCNCQHKGAKFDIINKIRIFLFLFANQMKIGDAVVFVLCNSFTANAKEKNPEGIGGWRDWLFSLSSAATTEATGIRCWM